MKNQAYYYKTLNQYKLLILKYKRERSGDRHKHKESQETFILSTLKNLKEYSCLAYK